MGVSVFSQEGIEVVHPWHDFKVAASRGVLTPDFFTFRDWEYAAGIRRLPAGGVFVTPRYEDLWGKGAILSVCSPVVSEGQRLGISCIDIDESRLFSLVRPYPAYLDTKKLAIGISGHLADQEKPFV